MMDATDHCVIWPLPGPDVIFMKLYALFCAPALLTAIVGGYIIGGSKH